MNLLRHSLRRGSRVSWGQTVPMRDQNNFTHHKQRMNMSARADLGKQDLVAIVSTNCSLTKADAKVAVDAIFDSIQAAVAAGDKISIPGFGSFERSVRSARQGRNPATGESLFIPESATPAFKAGSTFKNLVKERYAKE